MSGPFKMKGYSYPGTSPLKQGFEGIDPSKDVVKVTKGGGFEKIGKPKPTDTFQKWAHKTQHRPFDQLNKSSSKIPKPKATSVNVKNLVKSGKSVIGKSLGFLGSKALGVASAFLGSMSAATADQPKKSGEQTSIHWRPNIPGSKMKRKQTWQEHHSN